MNEVKFACKVITPMFMAGSDHRNPELRPPAFKGMMRFWWRAAKAERDIDKLQKEEAKIFGGTREKEGKSKIGIRIRYGELKEYKDKDLKRSYRLKWYYDNKTNSLKGQDAGIGYLLYSTTLPRKEREFIKDNFSFKIDFFSFEEKALRETLASFWLSVYLGGFGTRTRRGAGNISIEKVEGDNFGIDFIPKRLKTKIGLKEWLIKNIYRIKEIIPMGAGCKKYSNLKDASIFIFDWKQNWIEALNFIGNEFKHYRENNKSDVWRTPAFGMPVMHKRFKERFVPYKDGKTLERRSSPLIFKVIKSERLYFPAIVKLSGDIVSNGKVAREEKRRKWHLEGSRNIDESILNGFLNSLRNKVEVKIE